MAKNKFKLSYLKPLPTLKQMAYVKIKDAIMSYELKPRNLYKEQKIADDLGISKTPVREALLELASRGFLTFFPRKGFEIVELDERKIRNLMVLRQIIEVAVITIITSDIKKEAIKDLEKLLLKEKEYGMINDRYGLRKINRELHSYFASLTQNEYLISFLENTTDLIDWVVALSLEVEDRPPKALKEHTAIVDMLKKHDIKGAIAMMEVHMEETEKYILEAMKARWQKDK